jgi:RNA polymerase sigma-70 factor (ECF subfamily)
VFSYIRRRGHTPEDAEDLAQEFFARLIEKNYLSAAHRERGNFGCFLMACVRHFLANESDRSRAAKRGGGKAMAPIEGIEPPDRTTPERLYEQRWARGVLDRTMGRLRCEARCSASRARRFARMAPFLAGGSPDRSYAEVARDLAVSETAVKVGVHRLRRRYGALLRKEMAQTAGGRGDVEGEIRFLFRAAGRV